MIVLQGTHLERRFGSDVLFSDVNLTIQNTSRIALVGRNGTGKSTLLKLLAGIESPDEGHVTRTKGTYLAYMDQHASLETIHDNRTIYEEMLSVFSETITLLQQSETISDSLATLSTHPDSEEYQQVLKQYDTIQETLTQRNAYSYESEIRMVLSGFQFPESDWHKPIHTLSGGQRTRLALAKVLLEKQDVLILDEPTNHLDIETLTWLERYLPSYPGALLIVSHDRYFLDKVTNETYEMTHHGIEHYSGNYSFYLKERAIRYATHMKAYEKQQKEIAKLEDYVQRNIVRASTTKMAQSRRKQLEKMTRIERPKQDEKSPHIHFSTNRETGNIVLQTVDLGVGYNDQLLSYPINLDIRKQSAIAIVGPNGIGKSTLLKTLIQRIPPIKGEWHFGSNVDIGYYDQELGNLHSTKTVLHELWDDHPTLTEQTIRTLLGSFLFSGDDVEKTVTSLSGGEKARLELAKLSLQHDNFLLLDEPTNHLDIDSKEVLEDALITYDGTLLFVSHDRYFINRIATAIIELSANGSTLYLGDYDYYIQKKAEQEERKQIALSKTLEASQPSKTAEPISENQKQYRQNKAQQKQQRTLSRQLEQLEIKSSDIETQINSLQETMTSLEILNDFEALNQLNQELETLKSNQEDILAEWEEVAMAIEAIENT